MSISGCDDGKNNVCVGLYNQEVGGHAGFPHRGRSPRKLLQMYLGSDAFVSRTRRRGAERPGALWSWVEQNAGQLVGKDLKPPVNL